MLEYRINRFGISTLIIQFKDEISVAMAQIIDASLAQIKVECNEWIEFEIVSYSSITIGYKSDRVNYHDFKSKIDALLLNINPNSIKAHHRTFKLPICYQESFAWDVLRLEKELKLDRNTITRLHCEGTYYVFLMGFLPGFGYLGPLSEQLECSRLDTPRKVVPKGSVGIAGQQTGIYPMESPGGWNIIGRCPINLFEYHSSNPILLERGDRVKFHKITLEEYNELIFKVEERKFNYHELLIDES